MASKGLWALHFERNKGEAHETWARRFYELDDLDVKLDRPYAPLHIDSMTVPGSWGLVNSNSEMTWYPMCEPVVINEDNIVTVFNFTEGQMDKALVKMNRVSRNLYPAVSNGPSP